MLPGLVICLFDEVEPPLRGILPAAKTIAALLKFLLR